MAHDAVCLFRVGGRTGERRDAQGRVCLPPPSSSSRRFGAACDEDRIARQEWSGVEGFLVPRPWGQGMGARQLKFAKLECCQSVAAHLLRLLLFFEKEDGKCLREGLRGAAWEGQRIRSS